MRPARGPVGRAFLLAGRRRARRSALRRLQLTAPAGQLPPEGGTTSRRLATHSCSCRWRADKATPPRYPGTLSPVLAACREDGGEGQGRVGLCPRGRESFSPPRGRCIAGRCRIGEKDSRPLRRTTPLADRAKKTSAAPGDRGIKICFPGTTTAGNTVRRRWPYHTPASGRVRCCR